MPRLSIKLAHRKRCPWEVSALWPPTDLEYVRRKAAAAQTEVDGAPRDSSLHLPIIFYGPQVVVPASGWWMVAFNETQ